MSTNVSIDRNVNVYIKKDGFLGQVRRVELIIEYRSRNIKFVHELSSTEVSMLKSMLSMGMGYSNDIFRIYNKEGDQFGITPIDNGINTDDQLSYLHTTISKSALLKAL